MPTESAESKVTTDHAQIQKWVDERGGHPARVKGTQNKQGPGILRIDYPGFSGEETLGQSPGRRSLRLLKKTNLPFCIRKKPGTALKVGFPN
jgi:hypothetical protein